MGSRLRGLFQLDNIVPGLVVVVAFLVTLEPKMFGVEFSDRQIMLALFGLLGINAVLERSGYLYRMDRKLDQIARDLDREIPAGRVLRTRATFQRTETLIADAKRNVIIIGINLQAATHALPTILELARSGTVIRLLAVDPDGASLQHAARMSGVNPEIRRQKIRQNLDLIKSQIDSQLTTSARRKCSLQVVDRILPIGVIGVDTDGRTGWLIVQHYLTDTPAERAPLIWLRRDSDPEWYESYLDQCRACFDGAREW
ncbi:MAG TPA: DUF5919 domain-containing protein [Actinophytocola sp.]|uniref:DUF5919 domain-containing protein n=1 Tax=Actinophytocola sp. TaxID=1872138 RepID=UPI002E0668CD|nr:DUF5919 domain-containing protein [Actinophytocola sp.]